MEPIIAIEWAGGFPQGAVEARHGTLKGLQAARGEAEIKEDRFQFLKDGPCRLELAFSGTRLQPGPNPTLITVRTRENPFSFFLRDVCRNHPIFIPDYSAAVTDAGDSRSYAQIADAMAARGLQTALQALASQPEESFEEAARHTRRLRCETWLGLSRDYRIFAVGLRGDGQDTAGCEMWDWIAPRFHGMPVTLPETGDAAARYNFMMGRGFGCEHRLTRRLEEGVLPILTGTLEDGDIAYRFCAFTSLEAGPLTRTTLRGTHFLVADKHGAGNMMTPEQETLCRSLLPEEMNREEETVLYFRAEAVNTAPVPRYAWFKTAAPGAGSFTLDSATGFGKFDSGRVFSIATLNGQPMPQEEIAVLLQPGAAAVFELRLPHRPIDEARARALAAQDFDARRGECARFWREKLASAAKFRLPEKRVAEMAQAGLLHLDLVTYGLEPDGTAAATIGVYCPIGSESAPIIQFMDSMGWHDLARRSLMYFLDKQHEDGFIQNFGGYMLETGAALWSMGEHFRYTRDEIWVDGIADKLVKSCDYLIRWRNRNQREELRGRGYGMIDGKVGDPEDPFHIFMLNGYAYLGLSRAAEMLAFKDPRQSERLRAEAESLRQDIRDSFFEVMAKSPVVPLGDGSWCPTAAPWAEDNRGPVCLYAEPGQWFTHGTFTCRDSLTAPLYLVYQEVIGAGEAAAGFLENYHAELMCARNVALSQPYYSRHPWAHLKRGEAKAFLKAYYNCASALADRETYTFWEHFFHASPHKTHEEAWFLMETRWMLYMEDEDTLRLLPGIPRAWMEAEGVSVEGAATYFGPLTLKAAPSPGYNTISARIRCGSDRKPARVIIRLPHPQGRRAVRAEGGLYDPAAETVLIDDFRGEAEVVLRF
ncbi:MAG: hypothetical protein IT210_12825 [Armatimonadetes bacterium]|nr:hypothetical protein [Armatimonadota bacterium]